MKLVAPKVNAVLDENSFDTGRLLYVYLWLWQNNISELNMYVETLPDMQRLLSQNGEKVELAPRWRLFGFTLLRNIWRFIFSPDKIAVLSESPGASIGVRRCNDAWVWLIVGAA